MYTSILLVSLIAGAASFLLAHLIVTKVFRISEQKRKVTFFIIAIPLYFIIREGAHTLGLDDFKESLRNDNLKAEISENMLKTHGFEKIQQADPVFYAQLENKVTTSLTNGTSTDDVRRLITSELVNNLSTIVNRRSDADVRRFVFSSSDTLKTLHARDDYSCFHFIRQEGLTINDLSTMFGKEFMSEQSKYVIDLYSGKEFISEPISEAKFEEYFSPVVVKLYDRFGDDILLLDQPNIPDSKKSVFCESSIALYDEILALPVNQGTPILRYMLASS